MNDRVEKVMQNLNKNNIDCFYVESANEIFPIIEELVDDGATVSVGGSVTLTETGVLDYLRNGRYKFLDRYEPGLTADEISEVFRKSFYADAYFTSSNAVTEDGELYNVDGNANRISAIAFGPKKIIMIVGVNKIVKDMDEAVKRVKSISAPKNCERLGCDTYCRKEGHCMDMDGGIGKGCNSPARICRHYLVSARQTAIGRINVIIVNENLGY